MANVDHNRLLFVHQGALGDFVVTFPGLRLLRETHSRTGVLATGSHGRLACRFGLADEWQGLESARFVSLFAGPLAPEPKQLLSRFQTIVLISFSQSLEDRIRFYTGANVYRISPRPDPVIKIHVGAYLMDGLKQLGLIDDTASFDRAVYPLTDSYEKYHGIRNPLKVILHPGAGSLQKMWPLDRFLQVADHCRSMGWHPAFLIGPAEMALAQDLTGGPSAGLPIHVPGDLDDLMSLLLTADGFVGNDSGVAHLAAACGLPTVAVFGPSDPMRWHPLGPAVSVVRHQGDCEPCFETDPDNCDGASFLDGITPEMVFESLQGLMHEIRRPRDEVVRDEGRPLRWDEGRKG